MMYGISDNFALWELRDAAAGPASASATKTARSFAI